MKKVLKKFNRTLSIMLAAAMVLTMLPQTAMPVLAQEEGIEAQAEKPADDAPAAEENESEPSDVGETGEGSETAPEGNPEVNEESNDSDGDLEDDQEAEPAAPETPEEEQGDLNTDEPAEGTENPDEEVVEPTTDPETPVEEPADPEDTVTTSNQINAVESTESEITVEFKNDPESDTAKDTAEVVFLGGCVSSDNKLAKDRDLKFKVEPAAGRVVTLVEHQIGDAASGTKIEAASGTYTVSKSSFVKDGAALSGKIIVTTKAVNYKVSFEADKDGVGNSYKIYAVVPKSDDDSTEVLGDEATAALDVNYGESKKFALVLEKSGNTVENKLDSIVLNGQSIGTTPGKLSNKGNEESDCLVFTVDPSKCGDLADATEADTEAKVTVKVVAKAKLTVAFDSKNKYSTVEASTANTGDAFINYSSGFGTGFVEDDETNLQKSLAFKVTPEANYKITEVTAKTTADTVVGVTPGTPSADDGSVECTIALGQDALKGFSVDTTLTISIATELDTAKETVHAISFKNGEGNAPENVTINHGASNADTALTKSSFSVAGDSYKIKVAPKAGYELTKGGEDDVDGSNASLKDKQYVTINETRKYVDDSGKYTISGKPATHKELAYDSDSAQEITLKLADATGDKNYEGGDAEGAADKKYIVTSVDVVINTVVIQNDDEKIVHIDDQLGAGYDILSAGIIRDEEATEDEKNTWVIPETVNIFTFTVESDRTPAVTCGDEEVEASVADGVYTYAIPAVTLEGTSQAPTEIVIGAKDAPEEKDVKVKVAADDVTMTYEIDGEEQEETLEDLNAEGYYTLTNKPTEGTDILLTFVPKPGAVIEGLTYTMGETTGQESPDRHGNVTLELTVTDELSVEVATKSDYRVVLTNANGELAQDGDAYVADYTDTNISVKLTRAGVDYAKDFYDIVIKDGSATAATSADLSGASATIAKIDPTEYGKDLTIEVYINKSTKYTTILRTNAVSDSVTVSRMVNGKSVTVKETDTVDIMADSKLEFTVTPAKGASLSDLDVEILSAKDNAADADNTAAKALIERVEFTDGTLTIQAKPSAEKQGEVLVSIFNKNAKTEQGAADKTSLKGGKFILNLTDPLVKSAEIKDITATAGSGTNRDVRLNLNINFKNKKSLPAAPVVGDLYYRVELTAPTGAPADATVSTDLVKYYKVTDYANPAMTVTIPVVTTVTGDDVPKDVLVDIAEIISTTAKVTLVQSLDSTTDFSTNGAAIAADKYAVGPAAKAGDVALTTKAPVYETKLSVKAVNGAAVFTGQQNAKVATPVFGKNTAYDTVSVRFVNTKTGVLYGSSSIANGTASFDSGNFTAKVGEDNSILVSIDKSVKVNDDDYKDLLKTLGVKVTATAPNESYAASAVVKLKVQQGIYAIGADESKATLPRTLYKESDKKTASVKITALVNDGDKNYKPAKSTLKWSITDENGETDGLSAYMKGAISGAKPLVSVKNGTVTVAKDYKIQPNEEDNQFYVTIQAADFDGNKVDYQAGSFEITNEKNEIGKLVVMDDDLKVLDPTALTAEDFDDGVKIAALTTDASKKEKDQYEEEDFLPVTFTSGNKSAVSIGYHVWDGTFLLDFHKPANKIKMTATTVDGGKKVKAELILNVAAYSDLGLEIINVDEGTLSAPDVESISYSGGSNECYSLYLQHKDKSGEWVDESKYKTVKVAVKGGKLLSNKKWAKDSRSNNMGEAVVVTDKSGKATITLTDTATKKAKTYTITNTNPTAVKAPSIKMIDPKKVTFDTESITWQVTDKNNDNYAGSYVKLTPDYTVAVNANPAYYWLSKDDQTAPQKVVKIDENGRFEIDTLDDLELPYSGTYKLVATVGTMVNGEFVASAKDAKINFTIAKTKFNTNLAVTGNYTLDAKNASSAQIIVKTDASYNVSDAMNVIKKVQGKDDHTNNFTKYFEVKRWVHPTTKRFLYATIGLKSGLSAEDLAYITGQDPATAKAAKEDCTGYITVTNGYNTKDVQIKISFKDTKYTLTNASVFSNGTTGASVEATVRLMNGKNPAYPAIVAISSEDDHQFAKDIKFIDGDPNAIVIVSNTGEILPGKYKVNLLVVSQDSGYLSWDEANKKWILANDKTEGGKALTDAELFAKAGVPVTTTIEVKALDTKKVANVKNLNVTLSTGEYTEENGNGYVTENGKTGYYQVDVPYTIASTGTDIAAAADSVKVNLTKNDVDQNKVTVGGVAEDLVKASRATVDGKNVIRLQVSKKALVALTDAEPSTKPITAYGKKLKVPVEIKYTNGVTTTDTLNFNITMPKNKPMDFAAVKANLEENKAAIEKLQTGNSTDADEILENLAVKVLDKAISYVPADTDVTVDKATKYLSKPRDEGEKDESAETNDSADEIMEAGKAKVTLTLTDVSATSNNTENVSWTYTLGVKASEGDVDAVVEAIESADLKADNDTTAVSLLADIKKIEEVESRIGEGKGNISLKVSSFILSPATTKDDGLVYARVLVRNLVSGEYEFATVRITIKQLKSISLAKSAVAELFDENAEVLAIADACSGQETVMKEMILAQAKEAAENPGITISFKEEDWNYKKPTAAVTDNDGNTTTAAEDGSLSFALVLTAESGRTATVRSPEATINKDKAEKYLSLADAKTKIAGEIADAPEYTNLATLVGTAATANDSDAIKKTIADALDELIKTDATKELIGYEWAWAEEGGYSYTPATQKNKGKLSFKVELTLTGAKEAGMTSGVTETISVTDAEVVNADDGYQTAEELKEKIEAITTITLDAIPNDISGAKTALETEIGKVNTATTAITVTVENVAAAEGVTETTYAKTPDENPTKGEYKNVKITIGAGDDAVSITHNVTFEIKPSEG